MSHHLIAQNLSTLVAFPSDLPNTNLLEVFVKMSFRDDEDLSFDDVFGGNEMNLAPLDSPCSGKPLPPP